MTSPEPSRDTGTTDHRRPLIGPVVAGGTPASVPPVSAGRPVPPLFIRAQPSEADAAASQSGASADGGHGPAQSSIRGAATNEARAEADPITGIGHWFDDSWEEEADRSPSGGPVEGVAEQAQTDDSGSLPQESRTEADLEEDWGTPEAGGFEWALPEWRTREPEEAPGAMPSAQEAVGADPSLPEGLVPSAHAAPDEVDVFGSDTVEPAVGATSDSFGSSHAGAEPAEWPESYVPAEGWGAEPSPQAVEPVDEEAPFALTDGPGTTGLPSVGSAFEAEIDASTSAEDVDRVWADEPVPTTGAAEGLRPVTDAGQNEPTGDFEVFAGDLDPTGTMFADTPELPRVGPADETATELSVEGEAPAPEVFVSEPSTEAGVEPTSDAEAPDESWSDEWFTAAVVEADVAVEPEWSEDTEQTPPAYVEAAAAEPLPMRSGDALDQRAAELAVRLDRIAHSLRTRGAAGPLVDSAGDPLAALIAGYLLGMSDTREGGSGT